MSSIKHFRTELKIKMNTLESELDALAQRMICSEGSSEEAVRNHVESLFRRIARRRLAANMSGPESTQVSGNLADARCGDSSTPFVRSTRSRALAAMDAACVALDEAAQAALEAWLAERGESKETACAPVGTRIAAHEQ